VALGPDLKTLFEAQSDISDLVGTRCHQNRAPEQYGGAYLWFARRSIQHADTIDMAAGSGAVPFRQSFDVEGISKDGDEAMALADAVLALHAHRGAVGDGTVQGIFVYDRTDDYVPRGLMADEALEYSALEMEIVGYVPGS